MSKKEILVRHVTSEAEFQYGGLAVAFYDNPRTLKTKTIVQGREVKKEVVQDRLYISIDITGKKDHIKRAVKDGEVKRYAKAYALYLAAKKAGGRLDQTTELIDSLSDKNKQIEDNAKVVADKDAEIEALRKQIVEAQQEAKKKV